MTGTGHVSCTVTGTLKYSPPLLPAENEAITSTITAKLACSIGETGNAAVKVVTGKLVGSSPAAYGNCASHNPQHLDATITWKALGGKVNPSTVSFTDVRDQNSPNASYLGGEVLGSYVGETPDLQLTNGRTCSPKGVGWKKTSFTGTLDIRFACNSDILTGWGVSQVQNPERADDMHAWFVVASFCAYLPAAHPTGTMSWSFSDGPRDVCSGPVIEPIVDSGLSYAFTPWDRPPHEVDYTYWGVDTGHTVLEQNVCRGTLSVHYSGDSLYRAFTL